MKTRNTLFKLSNAATHAAKLCAASVTLLASSAVAGCWHDPGVVNLAESLAARHFMDVAAHMPSVVVCHDDDFAPQIAGDYNNGAHHVRVPVRTLGSGQLEMVLIHELGHAANSLRGTDDGSLHGHGAGWMHVMMNAGFAHEAARMAQMYPGGAETLAQVQGRRAAPPVAWVPPAPERPPQFQPPPVIYVPPPAPPVITFALPQGHWLPPVMFAPPPMFMPPRVVFGPPGFGPVMRVRMR